MRRPLTGEWINARRPRQSPYTPIFIRQLAYKIWCRAFYGEWVARCYIRLWIMYRLQMRSNRTMNYDDMKQEIHMLMRQIRAIQAEQAARITPLLDRVQVLQTQQRQLLEQKSGLHIGDCYHLSTELETILAIRNWQSDTVHEYSRFEVVDLRPDCVEIRDVDYRNSTSIVGSDAYDMIKRCKRVGDDE